MKHRLAFSVSRLAASLAVILCVSCTRHDNAAMVPKPMAAGTKDVVGYLAIPSVEKALKDVSAALDRFAPGQMTPEALKAKIGGMLKDPQLAGLEMEKPLVLCALRASKPGGPPSLAAMVPVKQAAPYDQTLADLGMKAQFSGGVLLVSQSPEGLEIASRARGMYDRIAGAGLQKTARLYIDLAGLMDAYWPLLEPQLDGLLDTLASATAAAPRGGARMAPESMEKMLKVEIEVIVALLRQGEAAQVDLDLGGTGVGIDQVVTARAGSSLAEGFTGSSGLPSPSASLIEGGGFLTGAFSFNPRSFAALFRQILEVVSKRSPGFFSDGAIALWADMGSWWGGTAAFSMRPGKEGGFVIAEVIDVLDEAKFLDMMEKAMALLAPGSGLGDMYRAMGLELKVEKAARQHAGVSIHRLKMSLVAPEKDANAPSAADMAFMKPWIKDGEVAFVKGRGVLSNDPADLDRMIDQVLSSTSRGITLEAQKVFGSGGHGYLDYDVLGLIKSVLSAMPEGQAAFPMAIFGKATSTKPLVFAVTFAEGRALLQARVPLEPFAQLARPNK